MPRRTGVSVPLAVKVRAGAGDGILSKVPGPPGISKNAPSISRACCPVRAEFTFPWNVSVPGEVPLAGMFAGTVPPLFAARSAKSGSWPAFQRAVDRRVADDAAEAGQSCALRDGHAGLQGQRAVDAQRAAGDGHVACRSCAPRDNKVADTGLGEPAGAQTPAPIGCLLRTHGDIGIGGQGRGTVRRAVEANEAVAIGRLVTRHAADLLRRREQDIREVPRRIGRIARCRTASAPDTADVAIDVPCK